MNVKIKWKQVRLAQFSSAYLPITNIDPLEIGAEESNKVIEWMEKTFTKYEFRRTDKGYIQKHIKNLGDYYEWSTSRSCVEFIVHSTENGWARIQFRHIEENGKKQSVYGKQALIELYRLIPELKEEVCEDEQKNEEAQRTAKIFYHIDEFCGAFEGIPAGRERFNGKTLQHVYSLDFHSAFISALAEIRPQWRDRLSNWFHQRKDNPDIKAYMVCAIGAMTNERITNNIFGIKKALSVLRYEILEHHAKKVNYLARILQKKGCIVLNLRTDSIKFICEDPTVLYDLPWEGPNLGEWSFEFQDCQYRQFSTGKYQYYDDAGKHHVKLNGKTMLDRVKKREEWTWDDLANTGAVIQTKFNKLTCRFAEVVNE